MLFIIICQALLKLQAEEKLLLEITDLWEKIVHIYYNSPCLSNYLILICAGSASCSLLNALPWHDYK